MHPSLPAFLTVKLSYGLISIALRLEDFICKKANLLKAGNIPCGRTKESGATRDTAAEAIMEHLRAKKGEEPKQEVKKAKKSRKGGNPDSGDDTPIDTGVLKSGEEWIADPIIDEESKAEVLRLTYAFWVVVTYNITYWRSISK